MTSRPKKAFGLAFYLMLSLGLISAALPALSQDQEIRPVTLGEAMPDFTLPIYQGLKKNEELRKKYDLEICFILPYFKDDRQPVSLVCGG